MSVLLGTFQVPTRLLLLETKLLRLLDVFLAVQSASVVQAYLIIAHHAHLAISWPAILVFLTAPQTAITTIQQQENVTNVQ